MSVDTFLQSPVRRLIVTALFLALVLAMVSLGAPRADFPPPDAGSSSQGAMPALATGGNPGNFGGVPGSTLAPPTGQEAGTLTPPSPFEAPVAPFSSPLQGRPSASSTANSPSASSNPGLGSSPGTTGLDVQETRCPRLGCRGARAGIAASPRPR